MDRDPKEWAWPLYVTGARVGHAKPGFLHTWTIDCDTSAVCVPVMIIAHERGNVSPAALTVGLAYREIGRMAGAEVTGPVEGPRIDALIRLARERQADDPRATEHLHNAVKVIGRPW